MKKKILILILFICNFGAYSQEDKSNQLNRESEEIPFAVIEKVPVYPGCEEFKTNEKLKTCLSKSIQQYVANNFNLETTKNLDLPNGVQQIFVQFKINTKGKTVSVKARAPHPDLEKEAIRVVESFPIMKPGEQKGKPVSVLYALPIKFQIEDAETPNKVLKKD